MIEQPSDGARAVGILLLFAMVMGVVLGMMVFDLLTQSDDEWTRECALHRPLAQCSADLEVLRRER